MNDDAARQEAERRTREQYGKDADPFGRYEFTAREYEQGFEDGAAWQAAQPVVVSAERALADMEARAAEWSATSDRMTQAVIADPHQSGYTSDDLIRYAAYAAAWKGAVSMLRAAVEADRG